MADSEAFNQACTLLEELTEFSRLEARGTIRLALKQGGLSPACVVASELLVVVRAILPNELVTRGVPEAEATCEKICAGLFGVDDSPREETPESVFSRLGSR